VKYDFIMCARAVKDGQFVAEPGPTHYLVVPEGQSPLPEHALKKTDLWIKKLRKQAVWGQDSRTQGERGDFDRNAFPTRKTDPAGCISFSRPEIWSL
jgi:hypothetical protein